MIPKLTDGLIVEEIADDCLVYVPGVHKVHSLNRSAACVFKMLRRGASLPTIKLELARVYALEPDGAEHMLAYALSRCRQAGLLQTSGSEPVLSRRQMMRAIGIKAAVLPAILTILAPRPALAASCVPNLDCSATYDGMPCCQTINEICCSVGGSYSCFEPVQCD